MNWTIGTFVISQGRLKPGATTEVEGLRSECGAWGIGHVQEQEYGEECFYTVTHRSSGMKSFMAESLVEANKYCVEMNARGDWRGDLGVQLDEVRGVATATTPLFLAMKAANREVVSLIREAREEAPQTTPEVPPAPAGGNGISE